MNVLAIDQAPRNCGWCYGDSSSDTPAKWGVMEFNSYGENGLLLQRDVRRWAISLMEICQPKVTYIEQIIHNIKRPNTVVSHLQYSVVGGIESACDFVGSDLFDVDVGTWRKRGLGRGNAPKWAVDRTNWLKDAALKACLERGWLIDNHHTAEAALIWDFGAAHCDADYRRRTAARVTRQRMAMEDRERAAA